MKILFLHRNFPAQFRYLAPQMKARGHEVAVMTARTNQNPQPLPHARYDHDLGKMPGLGGTYTAYAELGAAVARRAMQIRDRSGDVPDVIFGHHGWGETLFLKEVWPESRHLGYAEFLYGTEGLDVGFDPEFSASNFESRLRVVSRRAHLLQAAVQSDALLSPTEWQGSTFPPELRSKLSVIHDGVDTERCAPDPAATFELPDGRVLKVGDEVLTFVNRNLEPYRGFHTFMRALPKVLAARPEAQVVLVGGTGQGYGAVPRDGRSWKDVMLEEVGDRLDQSRLHFVGRIPYPKLLDLLRVGRAHAYLTYPFVLSWSMLEAMSLGCLVVGSATPPVMEAIEDGRTGRLVDFFDADGWAETLIDALTNPEAHRPLREAARRHIVETYDLQTVCLPRLVEFVETGGR